MSVDLRASSLSEVTDLLSWAEEASAGAAQAQRAAASHSAVSARQAQLRAVCRVRARSPAKSGPGGSYVVAEAARSHVASRTAKSVCAPPVVAASGAWSETRRGHGDRHRCGGGPAGASTCPIPAAVDRASKERPAPGRAGCIQVSRLAHGTLPCPKQARGACAPPAGQQAAWRRRLQVEQAVRR